MAWAYKRAEHLVLSAIDRNRLIERGETILIGVSGGADSLCLVHLLTKINLRTRRDWRLHALHIDLGFADTDPSRVVRACQKAGLECEVRRIDIPAALSLSRENPCYVCSRKRRHLLFRAAAELGARKVAFGHHLEDVNETFLLNLLCTASGSAILPCQSLFSGAMTVIRPLYYLDKRLIHACLHQARIRPLRQTCPYVRTSARSMLRRALARVGHRIPNAAANLFWGIHNLKPEYLPRKRTRMARQRET